MENNKNKNANKHEEEFSIEKELADMKKSLLDDDSAIIENAINEKVADNDANNSTQEEVAPLPVDAPVEDTKVIEETAPAKVDEVEKSEPAASKEEVKPVPKKQPAKKAPAKKAASKKTPAKKPLTEAQKLAKKEKEKQAKAKEAAKRKEAVKKAKAKEKEKQAIKQAKAKEKAKQALKEAKEKEKEKARLEAMIKREKEKAEARAIARKAAEDKLASLENAQKNQEVASDDVNAIKKPTHDTSLEKLGPKKVDVKKDSPAKKDENVSESLQRLREQIAAKKDLEQRIMDGKLAKDNEVKENLKELEAKNKNLKDKLEKVQAEVKDNKAEAIDEDAEVAKLRSEIASLEAKVKELEAKVELASKDNERLKEENANLALGVNEKYNEAVKAKDEEYAALQNRFDLEVARLSKEAEDLKNAGSVDTSKIEANLNKEYNAKVKALQKEHAKELKDKQKEVDQASKDLTSAKIQLTKANNSLLSKQEEINNLKADYSKQLDLANEEIALLKQDLDSEKDRNVKDADVLSEVEDERNKLVEKNRELEKGKKEVELQESYLNLYKQEIDAKADERVKLALDELAKYKKENVIKEDEIRADEAKKYLGLQDEVKELEAKLKEASVSSSELTKQNIDLDRKLAEANVSVNSLNDLNKSLNEEINRLSEKVRNLTNDNPTVEDGSLREELNAKELEVVSLNNEVEKLKEQLEIEKAAYAKQSEAIGKQLDEMLKGVEENETSIANTALVIENYREALENEKNAHLEAEQELYEALKEKELEIKRLEDTIRQSKRDQQIDRIADMVQDLSRRDMFGPRPPYQGPYYGYNDPYDNMVKEDHDREIAKRDQVIAGLQKERKQESDALNAKIEALEAQIKDLNEALAKKQENVSSNVDYKELEEYSSKIKELFKVNELTGFNNLASLLDAYKAAKRQNEFVYSNENDKLDIAFKYAGADVQDTIKAKKEMLDDVYAASIKMLDANLDKAVEDIKNGNVVSPVVAPASVDAVIVDLDAPAEVKKDLVSGEEVESTPDGDVVSQDAPIYDSYEEKVAAFEELAPLEAKQTPLIEANEEPQVVITFDSEYLNKLNNIRRTRKSLEERKVVENANHKIELSNNDALQKEYAHKIEELKARIEEISADYQNGEDHSEEAHEKYEVEKQKLFFELTTRQSQLNKLSDDDVRKINLRYQNIIKGIEDQLLRLEEEEKALKDTYLSKQAKEKSRLEREADLNKKFEEANVIKDDEPRIIESQDEIRERKYREFLDSQVSRQPRKLISEEQIADIKLNGKGEVVSGKDITSPIDKEEVKETLNNNVYVDLEEAPKQESPKEDIIDVKESKISPKEVELRKKYESFCQAEKTYSNDIASVREYKKLKEQYLSIEAAISENNDKIAGLTEVLKASGDENEIANLKNQINDLKAKGENLKNNRDYAKKQVNDASKDRRVKEYLKLVDKIEEAGNLIKKYQAKRDKKNR